MDLNHKRFLVNGDPPTLYLFGYGEEMSLFSTKSYSRIDEKLLADYDEYILLRKEFDEDIEIIKSL